MSTDIFWQIEDGALSIMMHNWEHFSAQQFIQAQQGEKKSDSILNVQQGVAVIPIQGSITPTPDFFAAMMGGNTPLNLLGAQLHEAMERQDVTSIIFDIDSGGGRASGVDEMANAIFQAGKVKPTVAQVSGAAGSAAYYLASQADKIYLDSRTTMTGSIGTRVILTDTSGAAEQAGAKVIPVDTGAMKSLGAPGVPITDDQIKVVQEHVNTLQSYFEQSVQRGRPQIEMDKVNNGQMFLAEESVQLGLADAIQPLHVTVRQLMDKVEVNSKASFVSKF